MYCVEIIRKLILIANFYLLIDLIYLAQIVYLTFEGKSILWINKY